MIELIANIVVITVLGATIIIVASAIVKAAAYLAVAGSTSTLHDPAADSIPHCLYCGQAFLGSERKCDNCGAVRQ